MTNDRRLNERMINRRCLNRRLVFTMPGPESQAMVGACTRGGLGTQPPVLITATPDLKSFLVGDRKFGFNN